MRVEVVGGQDTEIERGWGFGSAKPKFERNALIITCEPKTNGGGCRGCMCDGVGVVFEAVARCVGPIEWGAHFGWQNRKQSRVGSILVRYAQIKARTTEGVCAVGLVW